MPDNTHVDIMIAEEERHHEPGGEALDAQVLRDAGAQFAVQLGWLPGTPASSAFRERCRRLASALKPLFAALEATPSHAPVSDDFRWLRDNIPLVYSEMLNVTTELKPLRRLPHARARRGEIVPRVLAFAQAFLDVADNSFNEQGFTSFCQAFQETTILDLRELWALVPALKLILLERIAARGRCLVKDPTSAAFAVAVCIRSLRDVTHASWKAMLEPLVRFDVILRQDPAGAYPHMDFESRDLYRDRLAKIARHSDLTEMEVAREALALAQLARGKAYRDARIAQRESHIGFYLIGKGVAALCQRVGFMPSFVQKLRDSLARHPDEFFLPGIAILTFAIITGILLLLTPRESTPALVLLSMLFLLLPSSQSAVQVMNYLVTTLLPAQILPKLDFSEGIPADCVTLVAVPTLLLNEKQVRTLVEDLEVRFLGNHDPNVHFALLSDLPDSDQPAPEDSPLIDLCASLIAELNEKYAGHGVGSFFLLHRHRVYNPREKGWMGWERKRGKLLDLNRLLRSQYDSFPIKVGDLSVLPKVRFVITLDSDTELPRGSAQRMVGTLAHPLNQAIIDPDKNITIAGYGILQPRVGVSVQSTARSRLAAVYAGETGFDIYTRAVSDAYQDLYGEGSYTGKGIYEVDTVQRVLDRRFPRNALLSHDLIEGAYARAGLVSDIEVIEDYPSHYSAHNRRKHRWLRGDWQIAGWLFSHVPEESGAHVANPISLVSRWKILDNLRRSLVEPATFLLLLFGWLVHSRRPVLWTLATIFILLIPTWFELAFNLVRAMVERKSLIAHEAVSAFYAANFTVLLTLVFLAHQALVSLDAVVRALVRRMVTRERLLQWETAAEAEAGTRRTPVDRYLDWMPFLAIAIGLLIWGVRPHALPAALPVLCLWASSKLVALWLNESPLDSARDLPRQDVLFLRSSAVRTWRYFAEFCTEEHNWLIPDNVQQEPPAIASRISPTNLGFLLNARQVACEFGYLTVPELADLTQRTLATVSRLQKHNGHLLNWYDTRTLEPLPPGFVSSVDSGNLLASLWTLRQGCLDRLRRPLLDRSWAEGLRDYLRVLVDVRVLSRKQISSYESNLESENWLPAALDLPLALPQETRSPAKSRNASDAQWFREQTRLRLQSLHQLVRSHSPWWLPEFSLLRNDNVVNAKLMDLVPLQQRPRAISDLEDRLAKAMASVPDEDKFLYEALQQLLPEARSNALRLMDELRRIAVEAERLGDDMDFAFLLNPRRKLMSVGYDVQSQQLQPACYDLLATESRTAIFAAIAKEDIPQDTWFLLGRGHTLDHGRPVLLSWTGTMFEYLMPALWMRSFSNTLLERSRVAAVRSQQAFAASRGIPWGISESAYFKLDEAGNYQYQAFGLPQLSLMKRESKALVISPYSTFLALSVDPSAALENLRRMENLGWNGAYGFYEAADYTIFRSRFRWSRCQVVRCWMAHHQGMSLLSIANFLCSNVVQRWFHTDRRVQATELLLHEKPVSHVRPAELPYGSAAA